MKTKLLLSILILGGFCFAQQTDGPFDYLFHQTLPSGVPFAWPALGDQPAMEAVRKEDVLRLLQRLFPPESVKTVFALESFRFVPLERNRLYLVAVTDVNGRGFFNNLEMIRCQGNECTMAQGGSEADNDLDQQLVDVDGDGVFEIITRELAGGYDGTRTRPLYTYAIKRLAGRELVDVSSKYPDYFRDHILPKMEADKKEMEVRIAEAERPVPLSTQDLENPRKLTVEEEDQKRQRESEQKTWKAQAIAEMQYVQDEYRLRVLGEKAAGLENALRWARSDDPEIQGFGITALENIDAPAAADELRKLSRSSDKSTAESAGNALYRRAQRGFAPPKEVQ